MIEYHGWVTLCCTNQNWADDEDAARRNIEHEIARFSIEDGHWISFAETTESMQTLQLSGYTGQEIDPVLRLLEFVGKVVPDAYGELVMIEDAHPDLSAASRYRLAAGRVSRT